MAQISAHAGADELFRPTRLWRISNLWVNNIDRRVCFMATARMTQLTAPKPACSCNKTKGDDFYMHFVSSWFVLNYTMRIYVRWQFILKCNSSIIINVGRRCRCALVIKKLYTQSRVCVTTCNYYLSTQKISRGWNFIMRWKELPSVLFFSLAAAFNVFVFCASHLSGNIHLNCVPCKKRAASSQQGN